MKRLISFLIQLFSNYRGSSIPNTRVRRKKYRNKRDKRNVIARASKKRNR